MTSALRPIDADDWKCTNEQGEMSPPRGKGAARCSGLRTCHPRPVKFAPAWHEQQGPQFGGASAGDVSMVLLKVLAEVAGAAMEHSANRGVQRRGPVRHQSRQASGRPHFPNRGFTNGRGF